MSSTKLLQLKNYLNSLNVKYTLHKDLSYDLYPNNRRELRLAIYKETLSKHKRTNIVDLNHIHVDEIEDFSRAFDTIHYRVDISKWNMSNAKTLNGMFYNSKFDGDVSNWDVSNVKDMNATFSFCELNCDLSNWDVSNALDLSNMFYGNRSFNHDINNWDVSRAIDMDYMFAYTNFNGNLNKWKPKISAIGLQMFLECPLEKNPPIWFKHIQQLIEIEEEVE